jgi:hypothetical protein
MDGLSAFTTVTSVLDTAWKVISYVKAVAGADEDRRLLLRELVRARGLLSTLRDLQTEAEDEEWSRALQSLAGPEGPLERFKSLLEDIMAEAGINRVLEQAPQSSASAGQVATFNPDTSLLSKFRTRLQRSKSARSQPVTSMPIVHAQQKPPSVSQPNTATFVTSMQSAADNLKWPFTQSRIGELTEKLERIKSEYLLALNSDNIRLSKLIRNELSAVHSNVRNISDGVQTLGQDTMALKEHQEGSKRWTQEQEQIFLRTLRFTMRTTPEHTAFLKRHATWLLRNETFSRWQRDGGALLLTGRAGVGKTSICNIVDALLRTTGSSSDVCVVPIYFRFSSATVQSLQAVFACLVEEMIHTYPRLQKYYNKLMLTGEGELEVSDSLRIIHRARQDFQHFWIIIDALDECERGLALELVKRLTGLRGPPNIFATSLCEGADVLASHFTSQIKVTPTDIKEGVALFQKSMCTKS